MARFVRVAAEAASRFVRVRWNDQPEGVLPLEADTVLNASTPLLYAGGYLPE
jgi:hypothetical protein